jgi:hypothetical protein
VVFCAGGARTDQRCERDSKHRTPTNDEHVSIDTDGETWLSLLALELVRVYSTRTLLPLLSSSAAAVKRQDAFVLHFTYMRGSPLSDCSPSLCCWLALGGTSSGMSSASCTVASKTVGWYSCIVVVCRPAHCRLFFASFGLIALTRSCRCPLVHPPRQCCRLPNSFHLLR